MLKVTFNNLHHCGNINQRHTENDTSHKETASFVSINIH